MRDILDEKIPIKYRTELEFHNCLFFVGNFILFFISLEKLNLIHNKD